MSITEPTVTTYVEYLYPGSCWPEDVSEKVTVRDAAAVAVAAPPRVFAFRFYDVVSATATLGGLTVGLRSAVVNESGRYYIDAEKLTAAAVEALPGDHSALLSNMRGNGWDPILRCRTGNFQPLEPGDQIISSETGETS